ncbi:hypothetical protein QWY75_10420 [Pontixanthobacter aestiaquae]|uniref:Uncharacterized protein n=1 Tax=Pontixanthobacter aestiaquae TaxID=1509367 RepID=A0A844Z6D0_9SPHN|nr:hypothetical protein [Pontixanthobacter aestiaquae]MDN3646612.1 hypothetical protein [Pontixanthobacter aestiaquae]MXO82403.1 hypothetical protein [Pontixanthobacter aestiaquae]
MMRVGIAVGCAAMVMAAAGPAQAAECIGQANSPICALHMAAGDDGRITGKDEASRLIHLLAADSEFGQADKRLVAILIDRAAKGESFDYADKDGRSVTYGASDAEAVAHFRYMTEVPDVAAAMEGSGEMIANAGRYRAAVPPLFAREVDRRCAVVLDNAWKESTITNAYRPYSNRIASWYSSVKTLPPADFSHGRRLLYFCAKFHDQAHNNQVTNQLYDWLEP